MQKSVFFVLVVRAQSLSLSAPTVTTKGLCLRPEDTDGEFVSLGSPVVHRYQDQWCMWFHGRSSKSTAELPPISSGRVGLAVSEDGLNWKYLGLALSENTEDWWSFDAAHVGLGDVVPLGVNAHYRNFQDIPSYGMAKAMYTFGGSDSDTELRALGIDKDGTIPAMDLRIGVAISQGDLKTFARIEGEHPAGEILTVSDQGDWDSAYLGWPSIVDDSSSRRFISYQALDMRTRKHAIGIAQDQGNGIKFTKLSTQEPLFEAANIDDHPDDFDVGGVSRRCVRPPPSPEAPDQNFLMWYEATNKNGDHSIGLASSPDGFSSWTKVLNEPVFLPSKESPDAWDSGAVSAPYICQLDDIGALRMYYAASSSLASADQSKAGPKPMSIGVAESKDFGRTWERLAFQ